MGVENITLFSKSLFSLFRLFDNTFLLACGGKFLPFFHFPGFALLSFSSLYNFITDWCSAKAHILWLSFPPPPPQMRQEVSFRPVSCPSEAKKGGQILLLETNPDPLSGPGNLFFPLLFSRKDLLPPSLPVTSDIN